MMADWEADWGQIGGRLGGRFGGRIGDRIGDRIGGRAGGRLEADVPGATRQQLHGNLGPAWQVRSQWDRLGPA